MTAGPSPAELPMYLATVSIPFPRRATAKSIHYGILKPLAESAALV